MDRGEAASHPLAERIYTEAGEWVRMSNLIVWSVGALFIPSSLAAVAFAVNGEQTLPARILLGLASTALFGFWIYVSRLYGKSAATARRVLETIEDSAGVPEAASLYRMQGVVTREGLTLPRVQEIAFVVLLAAWIYICSSDTPRVQIRFPF